VPPRKRRIPVVLDTNIIVGYYLSRNPRSANAEIIRLWRDERKLQLIVSAEVEEEYLEILARLGVPEGLVNRFAARLRRRETVTRVGLGTRSTASRDPDDNVMIAAALSGRAKFLITNDHDLLDIPELERRKFRFEIVTPAEFLAQVEE
jgi:putative PIN family toxin of toxin-antitoxin system